MYNSFYSGLLRIFQILAHAVCLANPKGTQSEGEQSLGNDIYFCHYEAIAETTVRLTLWALASASNPQKFIQTIKYYLIFRMPEYRNNINY